MAKKQSIENSLSAGVDTMCVCGGREFVEMIFGTILRHPFLTGQMFFSFLRHQYKPFWKKKASQKCVFIKKSFQKPSLMAKRAFLVFSANNLK